jgi:Lon protease-like protein
MVKRAAENTAESPPETAPVFPLPDHVFLPASPAPYRVFEPRYRSLVEHLLRAPEERRWMAIPRLKSGWRQDYEGKPPFHEIAAVGRLTKCIPAADGTYQIVVDGGVRCRLEEVPSPYSFRMAHISPWPDLPPRISSARLEEQFDALIQIIAALARALGPGARGLVALANEKASHENRIFRLGSVLLQNPDRRQEFLECLQIGQRIDALVEAAAVLLTLATSGQEGGGRPRPS